MSDAGSDEDELRALPAGVLRPYKGWAGSELETLRAVRGGEGGEGGERLLKDGFQNKEVGEGYQYKSVVRQKGQGGSVGKVVDMTGGGGQKNDEKKKRRRRDDYDYDSDEEAQGPTLKDMLDNPEMRAFKREIVRLIK